MRCFAIRVLVTFVFGFASYAFAQDRQNDDQAMEVVTTIIERAIVADYEVARQAAHAQSNAMHTLCAAPDQLRLAAARAAFSAYVNAWSNVEWVRFGPARIENRFERLMFWPDRRSRGLRQVQKLIADPTAADLEPEDLKRKSVAVQGLLALEFVLHGRGWESLLRPSSSRCVYGRAIANAMERTLEDINSDWTIETGYSRIMRQTGADNPIYRSPGEVLQEILRAASEQLQIVRDLKIGAAIGATPDAAKPKRAPLWRSNLTLTMIDGNLQSIERLFAETGLDKLLPEDQTWLPDTLAFELKQARQVVAELRNSGDAWINLAKQPRGHQRLAYSQIPLAGAIRVLTEHIPPALGLALGFNSLDGD